MVNQIFNFRSTHLTSSRLFYTFVVAIFFWTLFDGIVSYTMPLVVSAHVSSSTEMGLIIGFSSIMGAVFDLVLSVVIKRPDFRRLFLYVLIVSALMPLLLWQATSISILLVAMVIWGLYYDLINFTQFNFISWHSTSQNSTTKFGLLVVFRSLAYALGPIIVGLLIARGNFHEPFILMWIMLLLAGISFIPLFSAKMQPRPAPEDEQESKSMLLELGYWFTIGKQIKYPLLFSLLFGLTDAFFWTIGPLYAESLNDIHPFNGLLLTLYLLPALFVAPIARRAVGRLGKKRTAFIFILLASLPLLLLWVVQAAYLVLIVVFISAVFRAFCLPAINAAYSDYIRESMVFEEEIESLLDLCSNLGYMLGPIIAGFMADIFSFGQTFGLMGAFTIGASLLLILLTPKKIKVQVLTSA